MSEIRTIAQDTSQWTGLIILLCVFGAAVGGLLVRPLLPEQHRSRETEEIIKLAMGVLATLSALVIGLLIASAKSAFDNKEAELQQLSGNLILLDRELAHYGPETNEMRDLLRRYTAYKIAITWPDEADVPPEREGWRLLETLQDRLLALAPSNDVQRWVQTRAITVSADIARTRWLLDVQRGTVIPTAFLVTLVFWVMIIFASFGLLAPRNVTVVATLFACSFSIAGAMVLIMSMAKPFSGPIQISSRSMREALEFIGKF